MKAVVGGSFYRFEDEIFDIALAFSRRGVEVLSPVERMDVVRRGCCFRYNAEAIHRDSI